MMGPAKSLLADVSLKDIPAILSKLTESEQHQLLVELEKLQELKEKELCQDKFLAFVEKVWPTFIPGRHHAKMAAAFEEVANGTCKRLIINMPPRHTKSEFASYLLPAWFLGKFPQKKIIETAHTAELAVGFGRKVRNLVDSDVYKSIFPGVGLQADSKAAGRWNTNKGGDYFAIGVGGAVTGKGADILIIDDPHSEQEATIAQTNPEVYDKVYEWYTSGPRQRLQPGGAIVIVMTRWSKRDLTGQVLKSSSYRDGEEWKVIEFPAILPSGNPLWPEFWPLPQLEALKNELPVSKWQAQYQQAPTSDVNAIIKREWWKVWEEESPPSCEFIIQSWDTAFLKTERSDYSACTTWGVFYKDDDAGVPQANLILLNAFKKRMEFPELKQKAFEEWKDWNPDSLIVEAKASGAPLLFELRSMGIPVQEYTPSKGNDKIARLNAVADMFASGHIWVPETRWADELVEEVASFPSGEHDDLVDSMTQALLRFRRGGFIRLASDEAEEIREFRRRKASYY
jgi:predicted phage terminase large subunit-like protein